MTIRTKKSSVLLLDRPLPTVRNRRRWKLTIRRLQSTSRPTKLSLCWRLKTSRIWFCWAWWDIVLLSRCVHWILVDPIAQLPTWHRPRMVWLMNSRKKVKLGGLRVWIFFFHFWESCGVWFPAHNERPAWITEEKLPSQSKNLTFLLPVNMCSQGHAPGQNPRRFPSLVHPYRVRGHDGADHASWTLARHPDDRGRDWIRDSSCSGNGERQSASAHCSVTSILTYHASLPSAASRGRGEAKNGEREGRNGEREKQAICSNSNCHRCGLWVHWCRDLYCLKIRIVPRINIP